MTTATRTSHRASAGLIAIGERLRFYEVISKTPVTEAELAKRTGAPVHLVVHWLAHQATEGYLTREVTTGRYASWCTVPARPSGHS
jgi:hypothetical protein